MTHDEIKTKSEETYPRITLYPGQSFTEAMQQAYTAGATWMQGEMEKELKCILATWDKLGGNKNYPTAVVAKWLLNDMAPAMAKIRSLLDKQQKP